MAQANKRSSERAGSGCGLQELLSPKLFKALSDPRRLALLARLAEAGEPCTVGSVAEGSGVDMSVVSRHLALLREAGIIQCEKRGKEVWCAVQARPLAKLLRELADALEACCPDGACETDERPAKRGAAAPARAR